MPDTLRLDALLAHAGCGTRNAVKRLIRAGRVRVDGVTVKRPPTPVSRAARITCNGAAVAAPPAVLHCLLHKPVGHSCSRDPAEAPLVHDLLPEHWRRVLEPAGRLDRATSGLLVLSTDGGLIHRLISRKRGVGKRYRVGYTGALADDAVARCRTGLALAAHERATAPAELIPETAPLAGAPGRATLILTEGRYHQVRRMFAALGATVVALHRDRIGELELPADLVPGACRPATAEELARLGT